MAADIRTNTYLPTHSPPRAGSSIPTKNPMSCPCLYYVYTHLYTPRIQAARRTRSRPSRAHRASMIARAHRRSLSRRAPPGERPWLEPMHRTRALTASYTGATRAARTKAAQRGWRESRTHPARKSAGLHNVCVGICNHRRRVLQLYSVHARSAPREFIYSSFLPDSLTPAGPRGGYKIIRWGATPF